MSTVNTADVAANKQLLSFHYAKQQGILLSQCSSDSATVLHHAPISFMTLIELRRHLARPLHFQQVPEEQFNHLLTQTFATTSDEALQIAQHLGEDADLKKLVETMPEAADLLDVEDAPMIRLLNALFLQAIKQRASDIHFETYAETMVVRFRVDGVLHKTLELPRLLATLAISRIKIMSKLDIAEKRMPQDGRISLKIAGQLLDVRVSILPSSHGERVVLRLLNRRQAQLNLTELGMDATSLTTVHRLIQKPHGLLLVTGPTGSGKTTSLYAILNELNDFTRNILTIEDPIEYDIVGIGQTAVNPKINLTFAKGLRAILRQDPDVVMIGEIRDLETAEIAVQASLTGHLVLSTLHTNSAVGAILRLQDMGIEPFLLSSCLLGVVAQRLVRLLCPHCKQTVTVTDMEQAWLPSNIDTIAQAQGCVACHKIGYQGRSGIYEVFAMDESLQRMVHDQQSEEQLLHYIRARNASLFNNGMQRVARGETSLTEVLRVSSGE